MPKLNGLDMIRKIRETDKETRVIIATAFLETSYLLDAIDLGLVKYLVKPISEDKLLPILKSCTHDIKENQSIFRLGIDIYFDILNKTLFVNAESILLTKKELAFLEITCKNKDRAVSYDELSLYIWQGQMSGDAIRAIVKELRKKITKSCIRNISGIGYQINILE